MDDVKKLEEAKRLYKDANADQRYVLERLFPELRKSEDEWIEDYWQHEKVTNPYSYDNGEEIQFDHQGFVSFCKKYCRKPAEWHVEDEQNLNACLGFIPDEFLARWLKDVIHAEYDEPAWSEQKAEGDWVVNNNGEPQLYQVTARSWPDSKIKEVENNLESFINTATLDEQYHLWTIKDAKPGDVLVTDSGRPFIFKGCLDEKHPNSPVAYCGIARDNYFYDCDGDDDWWTDENVHPATEEQRSLLFKKMKQAGYELDAEKKEMKKIEQKSAVWSGKNEYVFNKILNWCVLVNPTSSIFEELPKDKFVERLKSLKDRYTWKPSDDQMKALAWALGLAKNCGEECAFDLRTLLEDLKKLREE